MHLVFLAQQEVAPRPRPLDAERRIVELEPSFRLVLHGSLHRQRRTAEIAAKAAGWGAPVECDERWDEFVLAGAAARMAGRGPDAASAFQRWYEQAVDRWLAGEQQPGDEPRVDFVARVTAALRRAAQVPTAVVFTSGGPVATIAAELVGGGAPAFRRLMPAMVNTSVTQVVSRRRGFTLVSWNSHQHRAREQVRYR